MIAQWNLNVQTFLMNIPMWMNKVEGFKGFKADLVFKLTVSNTPYVAGRIKLAHVPFEDRETNYTRTTKCQLSQLKGAEIDLATETSVEFTIPYHSNYPYIDLSTGMGGWGSLYVYQYLPSVIPAGAPTPKLTLWYYFKNISLSTPICPTVSNIVPQAGRRKKLSQNPEETQEGVISGILSRTANVTEFIGSTIPALSAYVTPVSWISRTAAKVAASFGLSKPQCDQQTVFFRPETARHINNCDGIELAHNPALLHDYKIPVMPGFAGVDVDEMAISYVARIPACIATVSFGSQVSGTLIYSCYLSPDAMWYQNGAFNKNLSDLSGTTNAAPFPAVIPSPVCMISQLFEKYRGGFHFTLKFAKTAFHAGRLLVVFNPSAGLPGASNVTNRYAVPSYANVLYNERAYIDLKEGTDFSFHVPYRSLSPYLPTSYGFGTFNIYVVDPLVASGDVTNSINFVVEVCADEELCFAHPTTTPFVPVLTSPNIVAQSGTRQLGASPTMGDMEVAANTVGERIYSLKQVAMRPCWFDTSTVPNTAMWATNQPSFAPSQAAATSIARNNSDVLDYISSMYALRRGGVILRAYTYWESFWQSTLLNKGITDDRSPAVYKNGLPRSLDKTNVFSKYVPPYCTAFSQIIRSKESSDCSNIVTQIEVKSYNASSGTSNGAYSWARVLADDSMYGCFLSTPLLVQTNDSTY
jgi:hypothetical protein